MNPGIALTQALAALNSVPADVWVPVIETIVAAIVASPLITSLKKLLKVHSDKVNLALAIGTSLFAAAAAYLVNDPTFSAWLVPVHGWLIFATTQPVYRYLIKPLGRAIHRRLDAAIEFERLKKSAILPHDGITPV